MPAERFFIEESLILGQTVVLKGSEFHHLVRVMRAKEGKKVEIVNGQGSLAKAFVKAIKKENVELQIEDVQIENPTKVKIIIAQAIPKPNRIDFILEKGTELGADEFWLFPAQLSVKKDFSPSQIERLEAIIIAAMKQCGRLFLPKIIIKPALEKWPAFSSTTFFGDTEHNAPLFVNSLQQKSLLSPLIFVIGPESGLTIEEIDTLKKKGAQGVKLHDNILRTDTASLVALSLMKHWLLIS